jgi:hypothetical protein
MSFITTPTTRNRRRTLAGLATLAVATLATTGAASATTPPSVPDTAAAEMTPAPDAIAVDATPTVIVDESGAPLAQVTVLGVDPDWQDYPEWNAPDSDSQYIQVMLRVESLSARGLFEIRDTHFILQDADGFIFTGDVIQTAAEDEADAEVIDTAELAAGESFEFPVTFEVVTGVAPDTLYYFPGSSRLVTLGTLGSSEPVVTETTTPVTVSP